MTMKKSALKIAIAAAAFASAGAMAATNPTTVGTTSTGTVLVQVSKGSVVQISGLNDLILGNLTAGHAATTATDNFCVYSSVGNYHATLTSLNGIAYVDDNLPAGYDAGDTQATYQMSNGAGSFVAYSPTINVATANGSAQGPFLGNSTDVLCAGGTNASVSATIAANALDALPDGNYTDTLTIMVAPN